MTQSTQIHSSKNSVRSMEFRDIFQCERQHNKMVLLKEWTGRWLKGLDVWDWMQDFLRAFGQRWLVWNVTSSTDHHELLWVVRLQKRFGQKMQLILVTYEYLVVLLMCMCLVMRDLKQWELTRPHKRMTPPSTQNLKALGLWVFFLIYCSTFSFLPNMGLRLTWIPNNLPLKWESLLGYACLKPPSKRLSIQSQTVLARAVNQRLWYDLLEESEGETPGIFHKNENWVKPYKRMTPPSTQNLKALDLRVFFLICCSTFSFLPNVGLRLTLEYLTVVNGHMFGVVML